LDSTARGEAREDSGVDLFFDHPVGSIGLYELMDVKETASRILGRKADIMTRRSLHRVLRDRIEASALQVFWMTKRSPVARLTDIIEAIELIQSDMAGVGRYR
jgi:predicted nucleotidyltransferase